MNLQFSTIKEKALLGGQKLMGMPKKKKIIFAAVIGVLLLLLILRGILSSGKAVKAFSTARVDKGNISVVISGTGTIKPIDEYEVTSLVKGEILADTFQEGDLVEKGDLLYQIDSSDLENTLEKARLNLEKSQLSYDQTMDELSKLHVRSTYSGTITDLYVKVGDSVGNGTKIADIIDMRTMVLTVPFNDMDSSGISPGATAQITLSNSSFALSGTVRRVSNGTLVSSEGAMVRNVEIEVANPGALKEGDVAGAMIGNVACNSPGTFTYNLKTSILSETSGRVKALNCGAGDKVSAGSVVVTLESSSAEHTRRNSQISLRDSQLSIESYNKQLEDYQITAPISGTVLKKTSKAGDTLDNSNAQVVMAVIADMSTIVFEMNVDELDISKIAVGQKVSVTADALEDMRYSGYVDYVSVVGTTQNGVTTYPITVVVENPEGLIPGMNVSAEIVVESRENVLRVPVTAVNRGNVVYVKDDGKKEKEVLQQDGINPPQGMSMPEGAMPEMTKELSEKMKNSVPEGFRAVRVTTGLNDSNYIEILSGLSEGDEVYLPAMQGSSDNPMAAMMGMGSMGGAHMGSGMPMGGGMPSGGGMSGGR